jgi:hypothetical protein
MAPKPQDTTNPKKRRGKEVSCSSTYDPHNPSPIPPPIPPPPYNRFVSPEAEERFRVIEKFMWNKERGFDFDKLGKYPIFEDTFKQKGWEGIAKMVTEWGNATIAREFLVNASAEKESDTHAYVRGKKVNYSVNAIRRVLGLRAVKTCDVEVRKNATDVFRARAEWDVLLEGLMREGK